MLYLDYVTVKKWNVQILLPKYARVVVHIAVYNMTSFFASKKKFWAHLRVYPRLQTPPHHCMQLKAIRARRSQLRPRGRPIISITTIKWLKDRFVSFYWKGCKDSCCSFWPEILSNAILCGTFCAEIPPEVYLKLKKWSKSVKLKQNYHNSHQCQKL